MEKDQQISRRGNIGLVKFSLQCEPVGENEKETDLCVSYLMKFAQYTSTSVPSFVCQVEIHPEWRNYLAKQLRKFVVFRYRFCCWLIEMLWRIEAQGLGSVQLCEHCSMMFEPSSRCHTKSTNIHVKLGSLENAVHNLEPEIKWSIRILPRVYQYLHLEAVFAWLSTLGGAHSALGDYFNKHAEIAWILSVKQLLIALKIGDPVLATHCRLFMSISMIQRGNLSKASKIIRSVCCSIQEDDRLQEKRLINCCKAAWARLKYIKQQQKARQNGRKR